MDQTALKIITLNGVEKLRRMLHRKKGSTMNRCDTLCAVVETDPENLKAARHAKIPAVAAPQQHSEIARVLNHNPPIRH